MIEFFLSHMRHCARCERSFGRVNWLCESCEQWWFRQLCCQTRWVSPSIAHKYLLDWGPSDSLSPLIYSLKGGGRKREFQKWLPLFGPMNGSGSIYYPSHGTRDHAWDLASAFSEREGRPIQELLKQNKAKQALMSRRARLQDIQFASRKGPRCVDVVDDIVTTGATARACWKALGQPAKMTIWSLFYRKSL